MATVGILSTTGQTKHHRAAVKYAVEMATAMSVIIPGVRDFIRVIWMVGGHEDYFLDALLITTTSSTTSRTAITVPIHIPPPIHPPPPIQPPVWCIIDPFIAQVAPRTSSRRTRLHLAADTRCPEVNKRP